MSGTVKVIKVLASKTKGNVLMSKDLSAVKTRPSFEGGKFVVRVGDISPKKRTEDVITNSSNSTSAVTSEMEPSSTYTSVPNRRSQIVLKVEEDVELPQVPDISDTRVETQDHREGLNAAPMIEEKAVIVSDSKFVGVSLGTDATSGAIGQVKGILHKPREPVQHILDLDDGSGGEPLEHSTADLASRLPVDSDGGDLDVAKGSPVKLIPQRTEPSNALGLADPCCYPPSDRTVHLLKMLAAAEILSIKELAEIVAYITYLRRRKLVTDFLLKEAVVKEIEEMDDEPDDEPPIVPSTVRFPVKAEKRSAGFDEEGTPNKMPHLVEVLKRPDNVVNLMSNSVDMSQWPFSSSDGSPSARGALPPLSRPRLKLRPKKVMAACEMCGSRVNEKQLKAHARTCRGVIVKRRKAGSGQDEAEDRRERPCPRCEKVLNCDRDFEMHMAVAHKFYWRLDFDNEEEFGQWFREEGLDETMIAGPSKTHGDLHEKVFYCAINGGARMKVKCPCRLAIKRSPQGVVARYSVLHNHAERFVRQQMSNECRDLIIDMLKQGLRNYEILKTIKQTYPKTSMNYLVTSQAITRLRYRFHHMDKSPVGKRDLRSGAPRHRGRRSGRSDGGEAVAARSGVAFAAAEFGDEKPPEASVWPLPELQCAAMGLSTSYAEADGTLMH